MWLGELHSPWGSVGVLCVGPVVLVVGIRLLDQEEWGPVGWGERLQWTWAILPGPLVVHPCSRLEVIGRARAWVRPSSSGEQRDADEAVRRLTSRTWCEGVWNRCASSCTGHLSDVTAPPAPYHLFLRGLRSLGGALVGSLGAVVMWWLD